MTTTTTITEVPEGMKIILRGYCTRTNHSLSLDVETLYYLEKHGLGHYFVSRFPSGAKSHMGVYETTRFKVVREELVPIETKSTPLVVDSITQKDEVCEEVTADFLDEINAGNDNEAHVSHKEPLENGSQEDTLTQEQNQLLQRLNEDAGQEDDLPKEIPSVSDVPFVNHYLTQEEQALVEPPLINAMVLEQGKVYSARAAFKSPVCINVAIGETYYIIAKKLTNPYYSPKACCVYVDPECQKLLMLTSTHWFADIKEITEVRADEDVHVEEEMETTVTIKEVVQVAAPQTIEEVVQPIVEEIATEEGVTEVITEDNKQENEPSSKKVKKRKKVSEDQLVFDMFDL